MFYKHVFIGSNIHICITDRPKRPATAQDWFRWDINVCEPSDSFCDIIYILRSWICCTDIDVEGRGDKRPATSLRNVYFAELLAQAHRSQDL